MRVITTVACCLFACVAVAAETPGIPKEALDAMNFFVGEWTGEGSENGQPIEGEKDVRKWSPGQHCITIEGTGVEKGVRVHSSGLCGWDANAKQLTEHWFISTGLYAAVHYPLASMTQDVWEGTVRVTFPAGESYDGTCRLQKTEDGYTWRCTWEQDGKKMVRESVARKVKR